MSYATVSSHSIEHTDTVKLYIWPKASAVRESEVLVQRSSAQHGRGAEWSPGSLQERRNQTGSGARHDMAVPKNAVSALLWIWVLWTDGRGFAHDAVNAEGALCLRARLWLGAVCCAKLRSEVFRPATPPEIAQSLWQEVKGRRGHHDSLLQGHVADRSGGRGAYLALHAV